MDTDATDGIAAPPVPRQRRLNLGYVVIATIVLVFGALGFVVFVRPAARTVGSTWWSQAVLEDDDRTLTVEFTGSNPNTPRDSGCWVGYDAEAQDRGDHVDLTIWRSEPLILNPFGETSCTMEGHFRTLAVRLDAPLAGREVRDTSQNAAQPVFKRSMTADFPLPAAYTEDHREFDCGCSRTYTGPNGFLAVWQGTAPRPLQTADGMTTTDTVVHGQPAKLGRGRSEYLAIQWFEHGQWITFIWYGDPGRKIAVPDDSEALRIAETTHIPG